MRRRRRRKRIKTVAAFTSLMAILAGVPGATSSLDALKAIASSERGGRTIDSSDALASSTDFRREVFDKRPAPRPTSAPAAELSLQNPPSEYGSIGEVIYAAAAEFGIDGSYLLSVATCESGLDPNAYNAAGYYGLFQFDQTTWAAYGYGSIYDPVAQSRTAARLLAAGQASRWPNCA